MCSADRLNCDKCVLQTEKDFRAFLSDVVAGVRESVHALNPRAFLAGYLLKRTVIGMEQFATGW